ncbi:MAG: ATP-binding cassette domain-containing protein [Lachnospiraceae bacterium]|nr:ATP-binding cassette domain-containing protein [Lachnospiraceae bacterium]
MGQVIIEAHGLCKYYGGRTILQDVNIKIERGDAIALIGHNGTGKSTMLRMLSGLSSPSSGRILRSPDLKFAFIPENFPKLSMTVDKYIEHAGQIEGLTKKEVHEIADELYRMFYMEDMVDIPIKHLSKGTIQKVAVVQALLTQPNVILLDEPLAGQDIKSQKNFMKIIKDMNDNGVTVVMSCHEVFLVNQLAKSAYEIKNKTMVAIPVKRKQYTQESTLDAMLFDKGSGLSNVSPEVLQWVQHSTENDDVIQLIINREKSNEVLRIMLRDGFELRGMKGV